MSDVKVSAESGSTRKPIGKSLMFRSLIVIVLLVLLIPFALQGLATYSPAVKVRDQVNALGGRVHTVVAVPAFVQSIAGSDAAWWEKFYGGVHIDQIALDQSAATDNDLNVLQLTPGLTELRLRGTKIGDAGLSNLRHVGLLQRLDLNGTVTGDRGLESLRGLTALKELSLSATSVSDSGIAHLEELKNLTFLNLSGTKISDASLKRLADLPLLQTLILDQCQLTDEGLGVLSHSKSLVFLSVQGVPVTGHFVKSFINIPLEYLNLSGSNCDGTELGDLSKFTKLKLLSLEKCPVTDAGLPVIATAPNLETLSLDGTQVTDQGIAELKKMLQLKTLSLNSTGISAEGLRRMKDTPKLALVKAYNTNVTRAEIDAITAELKSFAISTASPSGG